jgi:class 3 adenylate cyclase/tetratricopeptide (TPR) repeat protein
MPCLNCGGTITPDQKFCFECGTSLTAACSNCGAPLPPGAKFCGECGTPVVATPVSPPDGPEDSPKPERRHVSVLFADLVGFTSTSENRDPEEVRDFLTRYSELASETIHRYGGTVDKFLGDGVMAIWGTPRAFEDDPERAVRAALDLVADVATLGNEFGIPELKMRAGITTGEAAVTLEHGDHGMVAGDLVNTASRLEASAEPGTVLVNEATCHATNEAIVYEDRGELELKGKTERVSVWRPLNVMAMRGGAGKAAGLEAPFVGRVAEFQLLRDLFKATVRDGRAHLVSIQGMPGIGKSRLVWEFEKHLDGLADTFFWHQGRSPAYGEGVTFWALGEMVRRRAGILENDPDDVTLARLSDAIEELIPEDDQEWVGEALTALLGVGESRMERDELFAAWRAFFQHLGSQQPCVMVFEDLQWADHGTIDFIESLIEWSRDYPIFVVILARPELLDRRPNWGAGQRGFTGIHVEPLSSDEMRELLAGLVPDLPEELNSAILDRSEGVPLYAVETVRMLIGQGHLVQGDTGYRLEGDLPELAVPETLHALVAARLDTLEPEDRHLLQIASVLGQTFTAKALADLTDLGPGEVEARLEPLIRREIIGVETDPRSPERGQYRFVQGVIREVAYAGLPRTEKSSLHLRVAELMAELGDDELAGVIASHYVDAYNAFEERDRDDALRRKALDALISAAERAYGLGSYAQAVDYFEKAMEATDEVGASVRLALRAGDAAVLAASSDLAHLHYSAALSGAKTLPEIDLELEAANGLAGVLLMESRIEDALALLEEYAIADYPEVTEQVAALHAQVSRANAFASRSEEAAGHIEKALVEGARLDLKELVADALITKGWVLALLDRSHEGEAVTEGAFHFAHRYGYPRTEFRALNNIASYSGWTEPSWVLGLLLPAYEEATRIGNLDDRSNLGAKVIGVSIDSGDWDLADRVIDELADMTLPWFARNQINGSRARLTAYRGDVERGITMLEDHEELLKESSSSQDAVTSFHLRSEILLAGGSPAAALAPAQEGLALELGLWDHALIATGIKSAVWLRDAEELRSLLDQGRSMTHRSDRFLAWLEVGDAAIRAFDGDRLEASEGFDAAAALLRDVEVPVDVGICLLDRIVTLGHDGHGVQQAAEEARRIFSDLGASAFLDRLDEILAG